jgi:glycosyltransferase involved in cell wall biosynthesis
MSVMRSLFEAARGVLFNSPGERALAERLYSLRNVRTSLMGEGVETDFTPDPGSCPVSGPFLLYAGRKDATKNLDLLLEYFTVYKRERPSSLKLVLMGNGPRITRECCVDLGYVDSGCKYGVFSKALAFCQPSLRESFSRVIMEAWLCVTPVLVHAGCDVTCGHVLASQGGLPFSDYFEFEACLDYLLENPEEAKRMAENGRRYVLANYTWDVVLDRFEAWISSL